MYISKIDDHVDKVIDDFYLEVILKNGEIKKMTDTKNFVEYQKQINDIIIKYTQTMGKKDLDELRPFLKNNEENIAIFIDMLKKYLFVYLFLHIGFNYESMMKEKKETGNINNMYANNIVEFTKNQPSFQHKVRNFFNTNSNSSIIRYFEMIQKIRKILSIKDESILEITLKKIEMKDAVEFMTMLGGDFINSAFRDEKLQSHNIIKTIILIEFYRKEDKREFFDAIESDDKDGGEYIYIDIVVPRRQYIDFESVEQLLTQKQIQQGMAQELWNFIIENQEQATSLEETVESKLLKLINSGLLVPIVDDFLLYHKDSEKYIPHGDNFHGNKNIDTYNVKRKEDTKIRYVVNKVDAVSEFYSSTTEKNKQLQNTIKNSFYTPLNYRKSVLVNHIEDIKIISKYINMGRKTGETLDLFNDLLSYQESPYMNFKDFKHSGFGITLNKTVDVVRQVSFEKIGDFRQNKFSNLQLRTASNNQLVNIVGFMIPTNTRPLECLKVKDIKDVHEVSKNGYDFTLSYIDEYVLKEEPHKSSVYWIFDLRKDTVTVDTYDHNSNINVQEQVKTIVSKLYTDLMTQIYFEIVSRIDKHKTLPIQKSFKIMDKVQKNTLNISRAEDLIINLEQKIFFDKSIKTEEKYDEKEDIFYGLTGDVLKLDDANKMTKKKFAKIKVDVTQEEVEKKISEEIEEIHGVCQHIITWDGISKLRKTDPNKYSDKLYEFIQHYVIENYEGEYVCKSCSTQIDIKKFIIDGAYDDESGRYIAFSTPIDLPLEEIEEYERFKIAIRNMDKLIEKISDITNVPYFMGISSSVRSRRKGVIKDAIDLIQLNNFYLRKNSKERKSQISKLYGIANELSNLFVFEFENNIFVFSSKEKDYYKSIKHNNVISYLMLLSLLEINDSHVTYMVGDKKGLCNWQIFEKYGHVLFDGLKIVVNNKGDTDNIKNYKVLCYVLYIMSCMITKYNMWHFEEKEERDENSSESDSESTPINKKKKVKKFNPLIQKIIIHTTVDILNSILENAAKAKGKRQQIFEIISTKFYMKLHTSFVSQEIIKRFDSELEKFSVASEKKTFIVVKQQSKPLAKEFTPIEYIESNYPTCRMPKVNFKPKSFTTQYYFRASQMTNCPDGRFHEWKGVDKDKKDVTCTKCNLALGDLEKEKANTKKEYEKYEHNYSNIKLREVAKKYCTTMQKHDFHDGKCIKCKKEEDHEYSQDELDSFNNYLVKRREKIRKIIEYNMIEKIDTSTYEKVKSSYEKEKDYYLNKFMDMLQVIIGNNTNIFKDFYLKNNVYVIDHDYDGKKIPKNIVLTDKENKIQFKENHPFFKTDVIFYSIQKNGKIEVFYDAISKNLLGYKETSKDFVKTHRTDISLKINYSFMNKIKAMGFESSYIPLQQRIIDRFMTYDRYEKITDDEREMFLEEVVKNIIRDRIQNLKKFLYETQRFINKLKNKYVQEIKNSGNQQSEKDKNNNNNKNYKDYKDKDEEQDDDEEEMKKEEQLLSQLDELQIKYTKKIPSINTETPRFFENWKKVVSNVYNKAKKIDLKLDKFSRTIDSETIRHIDEEGNILLYYIVIELQNLISDNANKNIRISLTQSIIEFINIIFSLFNTEKQNTNNDYKRFIYMVTSRVYSEDHENVISGKNETEGIYDEYSLEEKQDSQIIKGEDSVESDDDEKEEKMDAEEAEEAIDMDMDDFNYMGRYETNKDDYNRENNPTNPWSEWIAPLEL